MKSVVLIGGVHHNILGVVRAFGEIGLSSSIWVVLTDSANDFVSESKYLDKAHIRYVDGDPGIEPCLLSLKDSLGSDPVVICCSDGAIAAVDAAYDRLSSFYLVPDCGHEAGKLGAMLVKENQFEAAVKAGIRVPEHMIIRKGDDPARCGTWKTYPCILKPLDSTKGSKSDIVICDSAAELEHNRHLFLKSDVIVQRFIRKTAEYQFIGCSLSGGAEILIPGFTRILRQPDNTNTGYLEYRPFEDRFSDLRGRMEDFIRSIAYSGLFSIEFVEDENGDLYFLEINLRNDGNAYCVTAAGINLPYIWYSQTLPDSSGPAVHPIKVMPVTDDLRMLFHKKVGLLQWCREYFSADAYLDKNKLDPKPFRAKLKGAVRGFFYNKSKALYRRIEARKWIIGIADFTPDLILDRKSRLKVNWVDSADKDCWFADPFILDVTDSEFIVLVEEFPYSTGIGRIARLSIDRKTYVVQSKKTIIDTGSHLSFPAYFREAGKIYIYPENSRAGSLVLYEYDDATMVAKECGILLDQAVADAAIAEIDGKKQILATTCPEDNGSRLDIYPMDSSRPLRSVTFPDATARNAGLVFKIGDRSFRPAQDCTKSYGERVVIQEITLSEDGVSFNPIRTFTSSNPAYPLAFHTFNVYDGKYVIVDAQGHRNRFLGDLSLKMRLHF